MDSLSLSPQARLRPEIRLAQAVSEFEADLTTEQKTEFRAQRSLARERPPEIGDVMHLTALIDQKASSRTGNRTRSVGPRLTNFLQSVQQYVALGDVVVGGSQNLLACGVWALVRFSFLLATDYFVCLDKLSLLCMHAGRVAPRYQQLALLYPRSQKLQQDLSEYFIVVVQMCHQVLKFSKKSHIAQLSSTLDLKQYQDDLEPWASAIREEVALLMSVKLEDEAGEYSRFRAAMAKSLRFTGPHREAKDRFVILDACSVFDYQTPWKQARKIGTTRVFVNSDAYKKWKFDEITASRTLACIGKPGSGKSVLMASMVDDIYLHTAVEKIPVAYFFCRHDISESLLPRTIIGSLVRQLLSTIPVLPSIPATWDLQRSVDAEDLMSFFISTSKPWHHCFVVLDGLDECAAATRRTLLSYIRVLQDNIHLIFSVSFRSGAHSHLDTLASPTTFEIPADNPEIASFIDAELKQRVEGGFTVGDPNLILETREIQDNSKQPESRVMPAVTQPSSFETKSGTSGSAARSALEGASSLEYPASLTAPTSTNPPTDGPPAADDKQAQIDDDYSDAGSIAGSQPMYAHVLQNELLQDLHNLELGGGILEPLLASCLQEFAVRLGHQGFSQDHQNMMYVAHKYHEDIARAICQGQQEPHELSLMEESIHYDDDSLQDEAIPPVGDSSTLPPLYAARHTIDDWNSKTEHVELPDISPVEVDPWGEKLNFGHDTLRKSQAYQWLVSKMQRQADMMDTEPLQMNEHRKWLFDTLESVTPRERKQNHRVSRRRKPPIYTVNFDLNVDLLGFIRDQDYSEQDSHLIVSRVITLSGDGRFVQALPCQDYMKQVWPSTGLYLVKLLDNLAEAPSQRHTCILPDETDIAVELRDHSIAFMATGTKYGLAEVTEQLFWVSAALQTPTFDPGLSLNVAKPSPKVIGSIDGSFRPPLRPGGLEVEHVGTVSCAVTFESEHPSSELEHYTGDCWQQLFRHCAVVKGYPVLSRSSQNPGLEIPFDMMAALASAERIALFGDNLIVKGHSTLLFPTLLDDGCIFWHLICNDDGSRISFADQRIPLTAELGSSGHLQPDDVYHARHIVGWATNVDQNTGRIGANHKIGWSRLSEPSPGFVLENVCISAGKYINVSGTFVRGARDKPLRVLGSDYRKQLDDIGEQFVVLHDIETRKAWLVDGLSVLLHLTYANLAYADGTLSLLKPGDLQLGVGKGGPKAALATLMDPINTALRVRRKLDKPDVEEYVYLVDTIKYAIHILEQIIDHQADKRESSVGYGIRASPWAQMEGFDFKDIAMQSNRISPRATTLQADGEGWVKFTREIHAPTLFGTGFGDLLKPVPSSQGGRNKCIECYWNGNMPPHRDLLAMAGSDLERIIERRGTKTAHCWRVINELYLDITPDLFSECLDHSAQKRHPNCQQRVVQIRHGAGMDEPGAWEKLFSKFKPPRKRPQAPLQAPLDISAGGILLGMPPKSLFKLSDTLLSPISSNRASSVSGSSSVVPSSGSTNLTVPSK